MFASVLLLLEGCRTSLRTGIMGGGKCHVVNDSRKAPMCVLAVLRVVYVVSLEKHYAACVCMFQSYTKLLAASCCN